MSIYYTTERIPSSEQIVELYDLAGLPRPTHDRERIAKMYQHSNLVITAWDGDVLAGVARTITDWVWSSYLADLAIHPGYQKAGIGRKLIGLTKEKVGKQSMVLLLSVPTAMEYYPKVGFAKEDRGFIMHRSE